MTDFYALFNINPGLSLANINFELTKLEKLWINRTVTTPEKASRALADIADAKAAFKTEETRKEYDRKLRESKQTPEPVDPNAQRAEQLKKWKTQALHYYQDKQYDLAKIALEKAFSYLVGDDADFYNLAAGIYEGNQEYSHAISCINKSIVSEPDEPYYYYRKGCILDNCYLASTHSNKGEYIAQSRNAWILAARKARAKKDVSVLRDSLGSLAFSYYYRSSDTVNAEKYARESLNYGGDFGGHAKQILDDILQKRKASEDAARAREEARRKQEREEKERQEKAEAQRIEREKKTKQKKAVTAFVKIMNGVVWVATLLYCGFVIYNYFFNRTWPVVATQNLHTYLFMLLSALLVFTSKLKSRGAVGCKVFVIIAWAVLAIYSVYLLNSDSYFTTAMILSGVFIGVVIVSSLVGKALNKQIMKPFKDL